MAKHNISVTVNGTVHEAQVESRLLLVHLLREVFRLTGTHIGCDTSHCGACTVLLDGEHLPIPLQYVSFGSRFGLKNPQERRTDSEEAHPQRLERRQDKHGSRP